MGDCGFIVNFYTLKSVKILVVKIFKKINHLRFTFLPHEIYAKASLSE
jgi:hypothetical protein